MFPMFLDKSVTLPPTTTTSTRFLTPTLRHLFRTARGVVHSGNLNMAIQNPL